MRIAHSRTSLRCSFVHRPVLAEFLGDRGGFLQRFLIMLDDLWFLIGLDFDGDVLQHFSFQPIYFVSLD